MPLYDERVIRVGRGVAGAGTSLAPDAVTAPVMADLHAGPVALDEGGLLRRGVRGGLGAGPVGTDFVGSERRALHRPGAAYPDQGAGARRKTSSCEIIWGRVIGRTPLGGAITPAAQAAGTLTADKARRADGSSGRSQRRLGRSFAT